MKEVGGVWFPSHQHPCAANGSFHHKPFTVAQYSLEQNVCLDCDGAFFGLNSAISLGSEGNNKI